MDNKSNNGDSFNKKLPLPGNKKLFILLGIFILMIIIIIIVAMQGKNSGINNPKVMNSGNISKNTDKASTVKSSEMKAAPIPAQTDLSKEQVAVLKTAKVVVPGANPISADNVVLTPTGEPTDASARSIATSAPKQTGFLDKSTLPKTLVQVSIADGFFTPSSITTNVGAPTSFSLTSADHSVHVLNFDDPSLSAIVILVGPGQTKAITFNAPDKAGSYVFHDSTPGSKATGTLIVE